MASCSVSSPPPRCDLISRHEYRIHTFLTETKKADIPSQEPVEVMVQQLFPPISLFHQSNAPHHQPQPTLHQLPPGARRRHRAESHWTPIQHRGYDAGPDQSHTML
ncbi:unnamed protein product [Pleuronectes platessa]|uniref:Uncharacterized protein n=1 Tax=Pleuronectes platessa TaxID=8262 RepID=A0A9N7VT78_PLEPL|nr:unnamed protein product [Pleuronectes platessa]